MKRFGPQTLFGQTLLVLLAGIGLSMLAGAWIYGSARQEAVRAVGALAAAERIINLSRLVGEAPATWRERLVEGSSDPMFRIAISASRPAIQSSSSASDPSAMIADYIKQAMPARTVLVAVSTSADDQLKDDDEHRGPGPHFGPGVGFGSRAFGGMGAGQMQHGPMMHGPLARAAMSWRGLQAAVELTDGQWLSFSTLLPDTGPSMSPRLLAALAVMAGMIAVLTGWAVRRMTAPLRVLSEAALRLGRNVEAPALVASGTVEMRRAAESFNDMQGRLRRLIENRTLLLAAISHDLRTQLTLLRLRAESGDASEERERMLKTIAEMEEMLTATLSFAREEATSEQRKRVDVGALVTSIVDDMADAGLPVRLEERGESGGVSPTAIMDCKPVALRRAITNLIDNAVKYGSKALVAISVGAEEIEITIDDEGPGIPEDQLGRVLQPFYRLDASRNRDTGGIGLGLAIAVSIIEAHGGKLSLSNRPRGGLRARAVLPK